MTICQKRYFKSDVDATRFESENRIKYNNEQQYVYRCENCDGYHLTSSPPGNDTIAAVNYADFAVPKRTNGPVGARGETKARVMELYTQGLNRKEIAQGLAVSTATVDYHLSSVNTKRESIGAMSLDTLSEREKQLQEELQRIATKKTALLDAMQFKVSWCHGKILVSKEGNTIVASIEEWNGLFNRFEELATAPNVAA